MKRLAQRSNRRSAEREAYLSTKIRAAKTRESLSLKCRFLSHAKRPAWFVTSAWLCVADGIIVASAAHRGRGTALHRLPQKSLAKI